MSEFASTNNLLFEACPWNRNPEFTAFRIGTCEGIFNTGDKCYQILAVKNSNCGNGHFQDVLDWFENSCKRDGYSLRFMEIMNSKFLKHMTEKRGFKIEKRGDSVNVIKSFKL